MMINSTVYSRVCRQRVLGLHILHCHFSIFAALTNSLELRGVYSVLASNKIGHPFWTAIFQQQKLMAFTRKRDLATATSCCSKPAFMPPVELICSKRPRLVLSPLLCCRAAFRGARRVANIDFHVLKFSKLLLDVN